MKNLILTLVATIMALTACSPTTEQKGGKIAETTEFIPNINISTEVISQTEIKALIKTNFPESTSLTITASRDYKRKNINEQYSADLFYSHSSIVKNGQVSFTFNPLDHSWIDEYEALRNQNGKFDKKLTEIDINSIKDTIEISVLFTPKAKQPESVIKLLGSNGENLNGNDVETNTGGFKIYEKKLKFQNKYKISR